MGPYTFVSFHGLHSFLPTGPSSQTAAAPSRCFLVGCSASLSRRRHLLLRRCFLRLKPTLAKIGSNFKLPRFCTLQDSGMIQLFLAQADSTVARDDESTKSVISLLNRLGATIWHAIVVAGCRSEARLWLCNTISRLSSLSRRGQRDIFVSLLRSEPRGRTLASQLLQMLFEKRPDRAGPVIARRSHLLEQFFKGILSLSL